MLLKPSSFAFAQDVLQSEYELTCFGLSTAHTCSLLCCDMRQRLVDCSLFCVYMGPVPNESWVSLKADSGDNVTNFHFKASGSSRAEGVDLLWREYKRACRDTKWSVGVNIDFSRRLKYKQLMALAHCVGKPQTKWSSVAYMLSLQ